MRKGITTLNNNMLKWIDNTVSQKHIWLEIKTCYFPFQNQSNVNSDIQLFENINIICQEKHKKYYNRKQYRFCSQKKLLCISAFQFHGERFCLFLRQNLRISNANLFNSMPTFYALSMNLTWKVISKTDL